MPLLRMRLNLLGILNTNYSPPWVSVLHADLLMDIEEHNVEAHVMKGSWANIFLTGLFIYFGNSQTDRSFV